MEPASVQDAAEDSMQNAQGDDAVSGTIDESAALASYVSKRSPEQNRKAVAAGGIEVQWQPRPGADGVNTAQKQFPRQSICNWPHPDWKENRRLRLEHLYSATKRQCITLIFTGRDGGRGVKTQRPSTWRWAAEDGDDGGGEPMFRGGVPTPMPAYLVSALAAVPENAFVSYELTPWSNAQGVPRRGSGGGAHALDYVPPSSSDGSAPDYGEFPVGWMRADDRATFRGGNNTQFGGGAEGFSWADDERKRSVGKFVSGGQLIWMCTSAEEWTAKRAGRSDKEFDPKWDYLREAYTQDAGREGDTSITLKKQNADMTDGSTGRYKENFKPSAGFMMLRYSDTPMLMASRAGGGSGRYIHRTHQPTFHPASWSSNVGAYGPAIARLWWQPAGRTSRPKGWRNYGDPGMADTNLEYSREMNSVIDNNYVYDSRTKTWSKREPGTFRWRADDYRQATDGFDGAAVNDDGELSGDGTELFFGGRYDKVQRALQQLPAGSRLFGGGDANGFWRVVSSVSKGRAILGQAGGAPMAGNILRWTAFGT